RPIEPARSAALPAGGVSLYHVGKLQRPMPQASSPMTDFGESVMGWLPRAAGAALLLLGAACTSTFQASPPLEGNGAITDTASAQTNLEDLLNAPARGTDKYGYLNQQVTPTSYRTLFLAKLKPTYAITIKERNVEAEQFEVFAMDMT